VKIDGTDYNTQWADIAIDVQYHNRYATTAETLRSGATETLELYFFAQADGNGLAESAQSDTATTGFDIRRKLYYSEAAQADPDTGTWIQFADIADDTTYASAKATLLEYLKERTGGTVPISLKMTWEEVAQAPAFTGLLNESYGSGAEAAYSTRRLNGNVTECMVLRRASDSTTTTIGFDGSGNIDEAAINTFCSGTSCTVYQWLDQSGNDNTATAAASTNEPTIYTGGALVKENGKVALNFDGSDDFFDTSWTAGDTSELTVFNLASPTNNTTSSQLYDLRDANDDGLRLIMFDDSDLFFSANTNDLRTTAYVSGQQLVYSNYASSTIATAIDGSTENSTSGPASTSVTANAELFRDNSSAFYFLGKSQEAIFYLSDKSSVRTSIESNIGDYFTQNTPLLDTYTGAAAAYSLRRLSSSYSGSAIRVRRASDNTEQDIGFNVFGELDTVSLASFCSGTDGFVAKWYDQSGNANDATQTTTANQPKIYDSVTGVMTENGKPAVEADDTPQSLGFTSTAVGSAFMVYRKTADKVLSTLVGGSSAQQIDGGGTFGTFGKAINVFDGSTALVGTTAANNTNQYLGSVHLDTSDSVRLNGSQENTGTIGSVSVARIFQREDLVGDNRYVFVGRIQEVIIYSTAQSASNITGIESNVNTFYSIYS
jgi:hypothetical protein